MKVRGILLLPVFFLSGCAVFTPPNIYPPRSTTAQNLLYEATAAACETSTFIPRDADDDALVKTLGELQLKREKLVNDKDRWSGEQEALSYVRDLDYNIMTLQSKLAQFRAAKGLIAGYIDPKYYLDVRIERDKKKVFQYMLENAVKANGIYLIANENEADFKIVVNVAQSDLKYSKFSVFVYSYTITRAIVVLETNLVELKTKKAFFKGGSKCTAYRKQYQVLGVGPFQYQNMVK